MKKWIIIAVIAVLLAGGLFLVTRLDHQPAVPTAEQTPAAVSATMPPAQTPEAAPEPEPEVTPEPAATEPPDINPLTGEAAEPGLVARRPYVCMVNNISVAMPQVGISQADMIFELMEEGGITRMMAFFTDIGAVERVGSIRSARIYNVSMERAFDAILVHAGGSPEALSAIESGGDQDVCSVRGTYTGETFFRDPSRQSHGVEHSLFARGAAVAQSAQDLGYRLTHAEGYDGTYGLIFSETAAEQCAESASHVDVTYAGGKATKFTYDPETGLYSMEEYGSEYTDNGDTPVRFTNVLVLEANTTLQSDGLHLTIDLVGEGRGYFCCGGRYVPIRWSRGGDYDCFRFTLEDGAPLALGVGKTFVAVQQVGGYEGTTSFYD